MTDRAELIRRLAKQLFADATGKANEVPVDEWLDCYRQADPVGMVPIPLALDAVEAALRTADAEAAELRNMVDKVEVVLMDLISASNSAGQHMTYNAPTHELSAAISAARTFLLILESRNVR